MFANCALPTISLVADSACSVVWQCIGRVQRGASISTGTLIGPSGVICDNEVHCLSRGGHERGPKQRQHRSSFGTELANRSCKGALYLGGVSAAAGIPQIHVLLIQQRALVPGEAADLLLDEARYADRALDVQGVQQLQLHRVPTVQHQVAQSGLGRHSALQAQTASNLQCIDGYTWFELQNIK